MRLSPPPSATATLITAFVASRGYNYATAYEVALKLKELTYIVAEPYSSADFQHGPLALVEHGFPVVAIVPEGMLAGELIEFLPPVERARRRPDHRFRRNRRHWHWRKPPLPIPSGIPEWVSPLVTVVQGQLFALG